MDPSLEKATTSDLVKELEKREGVLRFTVPVEGKLELKINSIKEKPDFYEETHSDEGPAIILKVID